MGRLLTTLDHVFMRCRWCHKDLWPNFLTYHIVLPNPQCPGDIWWFETIQSIPWPMRLHMGGSARECLPSGTNGHDARDWWFFCGGDCRKLHLRRITIPGDS